MSRYPGLPFRNLTPGEWRNLALAAILAFYAIYAGMGLYWKGLFVSIGPDYLAVWSAGYLANTGGYASVYDISALRQVQEPLIPRPADPFLIFTVIPLPVLPVFILPLQVFALLPAGWSFLLWTIFNLSLLILYLRFFIRDVASERPSGQLLAMAVLSFPVFWTLLWGQVNIWLLICVGEFLRAMVKGKPFRAGLWLGGLCLKPQTLVLIVPILLLQRSWKALAGFVSASLALVGVSLGIGGFQAFYRLSGLWLRFVSALQTLSPQLMSNWRMVGWWFSSSSIPRVGWGIALIGFSLTVLAVVFLWRRRLSPSSAEWGVALLGTLAATGAVTWHSYTHMLVILIPPLLYLKCRHRLAAEAWDLWVFLMPFLIFVGLTMDLMGKLHILPLVHAESLGTTRGMMGISGFGLNLYLLSWAVRRMQSLEAGSSAQGVTQEE